MSLSVKRMTATIGAQITGIDLSQPVSSDQMAAILDLWHEHLVIVFPEQHAMSPERHIEFARQFGQLEVSSTLNSFSHPTYPEIFLLSNEVKDGNPSETRDVGWQWHTDLTFSCRPARGAVLHAKAIPELGGDTMFANMYAAYETLSPALRNLLDGLWAIHDNENSNWYAKRAHKPKARDSQEFVHKNRSFRHPMVRKHPVTGRRSLLLGESFVNEIYGMTEEESYPLLSYLLEHATRPECVFRHHWNVGDLLIWDNRCTMHRVVADHDEKPGENAINKLRVLHRVTLIGETDSGIEIGADAISDYTAHEEPATV